MKPTKKTSDLLAPLLLVGITLLTFAPILGHGFVNWDDDENVYENPHLNPPQATSLPAFWSAPYFHMYVPVTRTAWLGLAMLSESAPGKESAAPLDPWPFHAANLILHLVNALLVFAILRRITRSIWPACAGASFFALHPVQVEPVAWVTGMKDVLGAFWGLLALWLYLRASARDGIGGMGVSKHTAASTTWSWKGVILALLAFAMALLSKPTTAVIALFVVWFDLVGGLARSHGSTGREVLRLSPWFLLAIAAILVNAFVQPAPEVQVAPWQRAFVASDALVFYLGKLLLPVQLGIDYGRTPAKVLGQAQTYGFALIPLALALLAWMWRRRVPWFGLGLGLFVLGLAPVLGLVPFGYQSVSTVADRYLYLALLGPAVWIACFLRVRGVRAVWWVTVAGLVILAVLSAAQQATWKNAETLFRHGLQVNPSSRIAHYNWGIAHATEGRYADAAQHFRNVLERNPDDVEAQHALGRVLQLLGQYDEAMSHYQRALALSPQTFEILVDTAQLEALRGQFEPAFRLYRKALELRPHDARTLCAYGSALAAAGRLDEAAQRFSEALQADPNFQEARVKLQRARASASLLSDDPSP